MTDESYGHDEPTLPCAPRLGRRNLDQEPLTFPIAVSRIAIWGLATMIGVTGMLLVWLCLSTLSLRDQIKDMNAQLLLMAERANQQLDNQKRFTDDMQTLRLVDASMKMRLEEIELREAEHGWKRR